MLLYCRYVFEKILIILEETMKDGNNVLNIVGKQYKSKYNECKTGY